MIHTEPQRLLKHASEMCKHLLCETELVLRSDRNSFQLFLSKNSFVNELQWVTGACISRHGLIAPNEAAAHHLLPHTLLGVNQLNRQ